MHFDEAVAVLKTDTLSDDGTFTLLRLGQNPGKKRILRLRVALRVLWRALKQSPEIPRDIAYSCAVILVEDDACYRTFRTNAGYVDREAHDLVRSVRDLVSGALDVFAGQNADVIVRRDLGD